MIIYFDNYPFLLWKNNVIIFHLISRAGQKIDYQSIAITNSIEQKHLIGFVKCLTCFVASNNCTAFFSKLTFYTHCVFGTLTIQIRLNVNFFTIQTQYTSGLLSMYSWVCLVSARTDAEPITSKMQALADTEQTSIPESVMLIKIHETIIRRYNHITLDRYLIFDISTIVR